MIEGRVKVGALLRATRDVTTWMQRVGTIRGVSLQKNERVLLLEVYENPRRHGQTCDILRVLTAHGIVWVNDDNLLVIDESMQPGEVE